MSAQKQLRVPILAYHASNITGNVYQLNDHIAFESDLYTLHHAGYTIIPLYWIAEWLNGERELESLGDKLIGLSCDDGLDLDYKDGNYFDFGPQRCFYNILKAFVADVGHENQPHANLTSFVIACPDGRKKIDDVSFKHFSEKDINWKGEFVQPNFQSFLDTPFDLLIGYFSESHLYLEIAILKSKAGFKAGFSSVNTKLYDLEILEKIENSNQFFSELKKYLKILKKLKN